MNAGELKSTNALRPKSTHQMYVTAGLDSKLSSFRFPRIWPQQWIKIQSKSINNHQEAGTAVPASWWLFHGRLERNKAAGKTFHFVWSVSIGYHMNGGNVRKSENKTEKRENGSVLECLEQKKAGTHLALVQRGMQTVRNDFGFFSISDSSLLRAKARGLGGDSEDCCLSVTESTRGTVPFCCVCMSRGYRIELFINMLRSIDKSQHWNKGRASRATLLPVPKCSLQ